MADNTPDSDRTGEKGPTTGSSGILDRKIERRALPASFSSNLARRGMGSGRNTADRSVRSIVTLFENSAATSQSPASSGPVATTRKAGGRGKDDQETDHKAVKSVPSPTHQASEKEQKPPSRKITPISTSQQTEYQVEDYSLTLLGHKSYFNNRPLGRCLDEKLENNTETKVRRIEAKEEVGEVTKDDRGSEKHDGGHEQEVNKGPLSQKQVASAPVQHLESTTSGLTLQGTSESITTPESEIRDPKEVAELWNYVRKQLWIDDEEIYGEGLGKIEAVEDAVVTKGEDSEGFILDPLTPICGTLGSYSLSSGPEQLLPFPERPPPPSLDLSTSTPKCLDPDYFLYHEPDLSGLPPIRRPLPTPPIAPSHSRNPSSGGSGNGRWVRPPTWRTPSSTNPSPSLRAPSALPSPVPTPMGGSFTDYPPSSARINHRRNRHQPHISRSNTSEASFSASICSTAGTQGSERSIGHSEGHSEGHSRGPSAHQYLQQTPQYGHDHHGSQTSSAATRSTRADSAMGMSTASTGLVAEMEVESTSVGYQPNTPQRRMTAEEKLSEIDEFLSPSPEETERQMGGWI
ncbi:uncharacterized protein C8A04DRAFT_28088 [Dichotomopilus funicola]|uniref:Uncharacterized protein n=1 Tax=Dichotomopilus funicola TaxID=1934379 RepID=A0AAN6ZP49_9PEZI|nr:hypothetical protein C8A04DRAFT_28088 [Dichotomopilus funicola]